MSDFLDYCFSQPGIVLLPLEEVTEQGLGPRICSALEQRSAAGTCPLNGAWIKGFNRSVATYWSRTQSLAEQSPGDWLPPRSQHVVVVTDHTRVRPFFQPIHAASWLVYASDFAPDLSNHEFGAFALVHAERLGITRDLVVVVVQNLSYWLNRSDEEIAQFVAAAGRAQRPDAAGFSAMGEAMSWLRDIHHRHLRPPSPLIADTLTELNQTHFLLTQEQHRLMESLLKCWVDMSRGVANDHYAQFQSREDCAQTVTSWLKKRRPQLVLTDREQRVLWSPSRPKTAKLKTTLRGISSAAASSMIKDLDLIDRKTRRFLASLGDSRQLPEVHEESATPGGLSYMHRTLKRVAYNVHEAESQRLREPSPSFERLMLGARTVHEWCHLAVDAGWVRVTQEDRKKHDDTFAGLIELYAGLLEGLPEDQREPIKQSLMQVPSAQGNPARALAALPLDRMTDFQSNLLAQSYLTIAEMETYVRNNVHSLAFDQQTTGLMSRLARYAYEYQYLRFTSVSDPMRFVLSSTWIPEQYFAAGILNQTTFEALCELTGQLCDCYTIDHSHFRRTSQSSH